ncbi:MAG: hypothetical protein ABDH63_01220 [Candidatus Caldarchaeales archaeon]
MTTSFRTQAKQTLEVAELAKVLEVNLKPGQELRPERSLGSGVYYDVGGLKLPESRMYLLAEIGVLKVERHVAFPSCPICGSLDLAIDIHCPNCLSTDIEKVDLVIHYECHYADDISRFRTGSGELVCPVCSKTLKTVGIDYGRPGIGYSCNACNNKFQFPLYRITCRNGHIMKLDELALIRVPVFVYSPSAPVSRYEVLAVVARELERRLPRATIEQFVNKRGLLSSREHFIPLYVESANGKFAVTVVDEEATAFEQLTDIMVTALDLGVKFLVLMPESVERSLRNSISGRSGGQPQGLEEIFSPRLLRAMTYRSAEPSAAASEVLPRLEREIREG